MTRPVMLTVSFAVLFSAQTVFAIDSGKPSKGQIDHLNAICPRAGGSNAKLLGCIFNRCETGKLEADTFEATNARAEHQLKGARKAFGDCFSEITVFGALQKLTNGQAALELAYSGKGLRATKVSAFWDKFDRLVSEHGGCGGLIEFTYGLVQGPIEAILNEIVGFAHRVSIPLPDGNFIGMCAKEFTKGFVCAIPDTVKGAKDIGKFLVNAFQEAKSGGCAVIKAAVARAKGDPALACKVVSPISDFFRQISACVKALKSSEIWPLIASSVLAVGCNYLGGMMSGNILAEFGKNPVGKLSQIISKQLSKVVAASTKNLMAKWGPRIIDAAGNVTNPSYWMKFGKLQGKVLKIGRHSVQLDNLADAVNGIVQGELGNLAACKGN